MHKKGRVEGRPQLCKSAQIGKHAGSLGKNMLQKVIDSGLKALKHLAGILGVHEEGRLLHDIMAHHDDEVSMTDGHMHIIAVADGSSAHVLWLPCTQKRPRIKQPSALP